MKNITVTLPLTFKEATMNSLLNEIIAVDENDNIICLHESVIFDITDLQRIGVAGITIFSNIIELLKSQGVRTYFRYDKETLCTRLIYSGFAKKYINKDFAIARHIDAIQLDVIHPERIQDHLSNKIMPWMSECIGRFLDAPPPSTQELASIQAALQEIFNNINDHSHVDIGCYFGYFDRNTQSIQLCISDFGVGIPPRIKKEFKNIKHDSTAIAKACEKKYSTKSKPNNAGMGLHVLLQNTVHVNKGELIIYSNKGIYKAQNFNGRIVYDLLRNESFYPGTLIILRYPLHDICLDDVEDNFDWGMDLW